MTRFADAPICEGRLEHITIVPSQQLKMCCCDPVQAMVATGMATVTDDAQKAITQAMLLPLRQHLIEPAEIAVRSSLLHSALKGQGLVVPVGMLGTQRSQPTSRFYSGKHDQGPPLRRLKC